MSLLLEHVHHGHDRGIGDLAALQESFINIADRDRSALPDHLHDFQLLAGEGAASRPHTNKLVLIGQKSREKFGLLAASRRMWPLWAARGRVSAVESRTAKLSYRNRSMAQWWWTPTVGMA